MISKKFASLLVAGTLVATMGTMTAFAGTTAADLPFCNVSGCTTPGNHQHDGTTYVAHYSNDGHTYHANCGVSGCSISGTHSTHNANHTSGRHNNHRSGGHH